MSNDEQIQQSDVNPENDELNDQELESAVGGVTGGGRRGRPSTAVYCPKCGGVHELHGVCLVGA